MKAILEHVSHSELDCVHAFYYEREHFESPWHFHPEFELTLVLKSAGIRYVGDNISDYEEGDLVLIGSNLPHCWKDESSQGICRSLVIQWSQNVVHDLPVFHGILDLLHKSQRGLVISGNNKDLIMSKMHDLLKSHSIERYLILIELLQFIVSDADFEYLAGNAEYDLSTTTTSRLELVQTYVKNHYREHIKLSEVSSVLSMSEQSFSRFFSKTMNKPFVVFLNEYRINIASRLIYETDLQMSEVAYKCGYNSLPFFYKQFQKFKDCTPLEFRKKHQAIGH